MIFAHTLGGTRYTFGSLRELLAEAALLRSCDALAGLAAELVEEKASTQLCFYLKEARRGQLTGVMPKPANLRKAELK